MSSDKSKVEKPIIKDKASIENAIQTLFDHWNAPDKVHGLDQCYTCQELENPIVARGPAVLEPLLQRYRGGSFGEYTRKSFVDLIGQLGNLEALDFLTETLKDPDLHWVTIWVLGLINNFQALPLLVEVLAQDDDKYARLAAVEAIANLDLYGSIKPILSALKDVDADVRNEAIQVLGAAGDSRALVYLEQVIIQDEGKTWVGKSLKTTAAEAIELIKGQLAGTIILPKYKYSDLIKILLIKGTYQPIGPDNKQSH